MLNSTDESKFRKKRAVLKGSRWSLGCFDKNNVDSVYLFDFAVW